MQPLAKRMFVEFRRRARQFVEHLFEFRYREVMMLAAVAIGVFTTIGLFPGWENTTTGLQTDVTFVDFALFFVVAALAGAVKGITGFGFVAIVTPVLALLINPTVAVIVLSVPPWFLNLFQIGETRSGLAMIKREWMLLGFTVVGSAIGVFALSEIVLDAELLLFIGFLIWGYVGFQIIQNFVTFPTASHPAIRSIVGFVTGVVTAVTNIGIIFPIYVHLFERDTERFVGLMGMLFLFLLTERIVQMWFMGLMTPYLLWLGAAIAIVSFVGLGIGSYLRRLRIDERRFNRFIVGILFIIGLNIVRKTAPTVFL